MPPNDKGVIVLDTETTGTNPDRDQIIELSVREGLGDSARCTTWRVKPAVPIPPDAQAVHGISMEDVADCRPFAHHAADIRRVVAAAAVLVGYNLRFDLDMVQGEFARAGQRPLDLAGKFLIDPLRLWRRCEPRSLEDAHRRFVGVPLGDAHSATADTAATARVLLAMITAFGLEDRTWADLATVCEPDRHLWIGPTHHLQWRDGVPTVMFGRYKGTPLATLAAEDNGGYLRWILRRDFPQHVNVICTKALEFDAEALRAWLAAAFTPPKTPGRFDAPCPYA